MNPQIAEFLISPCFSLTATDRLILVTLANHATGMRIADIARLSGSKFRSIARQVSKLAQMGILRRVAAGAYALSDQAEISP